VGSGRLFREASGRPGWGIALFPLPYLALLLLFPALADRWLIALPMAVLAFSDAAAAVCGTLVRSPSYHLTRDRKTFGGSLAFVAATTLLVLCWPSPLKELPWHTLFSIALLLSLLLAALEALGSTGWDNVWIPAGAATMLSKLQYGNELEHLNAAWATALIAIPFAWATVRKGWLTLGGAVSAAVLGCAVVWTQGAAWLIPLLFFFTSSTLLGLWARSKRSTSDAKHGRPRDPEQVLSNGGVYLVAAVLLPEQQAHLAMVVSMSVATADTWASEIGMAVRGRTLDLRSGRVVAPGLSGGISMAGTAGAVVGATLLAFVGAMLHRSSVDRVVIIAAWGLAGMLLDSALGAWAQVRYQVHNGAWQDQDGNGVVRRRGLVWMSNDRVNLISIVLITALALTIDAYG
jgi:uncharacterized protein (TIGR00297 family)